MRLLTTFIISLVSFSVLYIYQVDNPFLIGLVAIFILAVVLYPTLQATLLETNIEKIERFLLKNKKNSNFYIIYALANERDDEVKEETKKLLQKYKQESRQALYKIGEALYFKDFITVKSQINFIRSPTYKQYYQVIILIEEGDMEGADELIEKIPTKWMKYALLAERQKRLNNLSEAKDYANMAKQDTKGLQRYLLHKTYEREFGMN